MAVNVKMGVDIAGHHQHAGGVAHRANGSDGRFQRVTGTELKITQIQTDREGNTSTGAVNDFRKIQQHIFPSSQSCTKHYSDFYSICQTLFFKKF